MRRYKRKKLKKLTGIISSFIFLFSSLFLPYTVLKGEEKAEIYEEDVFKELTYEKETPPLKEEIILPEEEASAPSVTFPEEAEKILPEVPLKFRKPCIEADLSYKAHGGFLHTHGISLKNATQFSNEEISSLLDTPMKMRFKKTKSPQFLIYHTHATESFNSADREFYDSRYNWRSRDNTLNMVSVGNFALNELEKADIPYIHDTSQHDYPSYNGSYKNSFNSVSKILSENAEIKVALDLHRDAIQKVSGEITKPTLTLSDGTKVAQIMIIANCDDGSGLIPNWRENFRFAKEVYLALEKICPGIARPILLSHRKYNQQLSTGALLIEVGGHANTLEEAQRAGKVLGLALKEIYENFQE